VDTCVDEFLEEWARVSKMVVIAREGSYVSSLMGLSTLNKHPLP
jgi:mediator of RNA polymerase II transcription subunit 14